MIVLIAAVLGAIIYRWRGSDYSLPRPILQAVFALPYGYISWIHAHWWAIPIYALTVAAICIGHGGWQDLGTWEKPREDEKFEFLIKWLHGRIPEYWYDFIGLCLSGFLITWGAGIVTNGLILYFSGTLKAVAYAISWRVVKTTWLAEVLTGAFLWGTAALYF